MTDSGAAFGLSNAEAPLDPSTWEFDDWIDQVSRPTEIVRLYGKNHLNEKMKELEREMRLLEKRVSEEDLGITDGGAYLSTLQAEWDEVAAEFAASARPFKVQALTGDEVQEAHKKAQRAKAAEGDTAIYVVADGIVEPRGITVQKLFRLRASAGDAGLAQLYATIMRLSNNTVQPSVPFSLRPSGGRGTQGS